MDGNSNQDQQQEPDHMGSQLFGELLAGPKSPQLFLHQQHPSSATAEASLSLFFPGTYQPHNQSNDEAGTNTYSTSRTHNPTITPTTTNEIASAAPGPEATRAADQIEAPLASTTRFRWMRELFSMGQWQELELQALIYKYMLAGASVPMELILPIKRSLLTKAALTQHQHQLLQYPFHHSSPLLQAGGYWGRCVMDPEPGRCRRTDGKKWRCSREVMAGRKYCERHALRGKNRSRKPVEGPSPPPVRVGRGTGDSTFPSSMNMMPTLKESGSLSSVPSPSAMGMDSHDQRPPSDHRTIAGRCLPESYQYPTFSHAGLPNDDSSGRVLRHFFDDWPRAAQQGPHDTSVNKAILGLHQPASSLSISAAATENQPSDFCLKLYTGSPDKCSPGCRSKEKARFVGDEQLGLPQACQAWPGLGRQMVEQASMGGPLAEALGASNSSVPLPSAMTILQRPM